MPSIRDGRQSASLSRHGERERLGKSELSADAKNKKRALES